MRTSNPVFGSRFERLAREMPAMGETMTVGGTAMKTAILLVLVLLSATVVWWYFFVEVNLALVQLLILVGLVGGLVIGLAAAFLPKYAAVTAPAYALFEGLFLGGISALFEIPFPGIVLQAVGLTFGVFALILLLYSVRILRATPRFAKGIIAATGAIFFVYLIGIILTLFGIPVFFFSSSDPWSIGFSVLVVAIAALNFVLDFGFIEEGANHGASKHLEWYAAFGLLVTLVWLYIEILRLLAKIRSR